MRASIAGVKDTVFVAYAIMLLADVNHDNYRNIGDLTAIVDHVIGRKTLTGFDFNKADMYPRRSNGTSGDGLFVCNLRFINIRGDIKFAQHPVYNDLQMELPHTAYDRLPGLFIVGDLKSRVLFRQSIQCHPKFLFVGFCLRLY